MIRGKVNHLLEALTRAFVIEIVECVVAIRAEGIELLAFALARNRHERQEHNETKRNGFHPANHANPVNPVKNDLSDTKPTATHAAMKKDNFFYTRQHVTPAPNLLPQPHDHLHRWTTLDRYALRSPHPSTADGHRYSAANLPDISRHGDGARERTRSPRSNPGRKLLVGTHRAHSEHGAIHELSQNAPVAPCAHKHSRSGSRSLHEVAQLCRTLSARTGDAASLVLLVARTRPHQTQRHDRAGAELSWNRSGLLGRALFRWRG